MSAYAVLFTFTRRTHLPLLIAASSLATLAGTIPPATSILVGKLMNFFSQFDAGSIDKNDLERKTQPWILGLVILGSGASLIRTLFYCAWIVNGEVQAKIVRENLFSSLVVRDYEWFEVQTSGLGSLLGRLQVQIREFQLAVSQPLGMVFLTISQTVSSLAVAFYYSWKLTFVLLAVFPLIVLTLSFLNRGLQNAIEDQHKEMANAAKQVSHATSNVTLLKCYNGLPKETLRYQHILRLVLQHYRKQALKAARQIAFMRLAALALVAIALSFGTYLVHESGADTGAILSTFWCCGTASRGFSEILAQSLVLEKGCASAMALKNLINLVRRGKRLARESNGCIPQNLVGDIDFQNVTFAYPSNPGQLVLNRLNLSFPARQTIFVVGTSGSGKSTISHLLLKLYTPEGGTIKIDGKSLGQLETNWLRNNITVVQQDCTLFNESLSKNIALGYHNLEEVKEHQIHDSAEFAMLADTIEALPHGVDTIVGKGGCKLSGGQRQRVTLARARLRDAPILVLDECTSALDHSTRDKLHKNIRMWRRGKSTVIITHDLSQIEPSDFAYVLRNGVVVAQGRRADLDLLSEWPSDINEPVVLRASSATFQEPVSYAGDRNSQWKHSSFSLGSVHDTTNSEVFDEHVALLQHTAVSTHVVQKDRGRAFRAFLRSEGPQTFQSPLSGLDTQDHTLDEVIHSSEHEMSRMTKSRLVRNRLTITPSARPYSTYPSLSTKFVDPDEELSLPVPHKMVNSAPSHENNMENFASTELVNIAVRSTPDKPSLRRILLTVWPSLSSVSRRWLVGALIMSVVYGAVPSVVSWITVKLFQTFYQPSGWIEASRRWSQILMAVASAEAVAAFCIHLAFETLAQTWVNVLRVSALTTVLNKPKSWFDEETRSLDEICTTIDRGAEEMRNILGRFVPFVLIVIVMVSVSVILCMVKCWKLTMLGIGCAPIIYIVTKIFQMTSVSWESRTTNAVNTISDVFSESFCDVRTVRALTLESFFHRKFITANILAFETGLRRAISIGICFGVSESLIPFIIAAVFKYAIIVTRSQDFPTQNILIVLSSMIFTMLGASAILAFIPQISSSTESGARLLQLTQSASPSAEPNGKLKLEDGGFRNTIQLCNITFAYPTCPDAVILRNLSLNFPPGKITAIVGKSGSGKSTILSLILGLYLVSRHGAEASISISGHDIADLDISNLRSCIAYVPQQPTLFPMSIRDNILYGVDANQPLSAKDELLFSAAKAAGIADFITSLPEAYDTLVGDGGSGVSGGQAQRIAVARALARRPRILLMDEPTSALDAESAIVIRNTIRAQKGRADGIGKTIIIVTHCEEMMKLADDVVVLEYGRVVEQGGYAELMQCNGRLRQLLRSGQTDQ